MPKVEYFGGQELVILRKLWVLTTLYVPTKSWHILGEDQRPIWWIGTPRRVFKKMHIDHNKLTMSPWRSWKNSLNKREWQDPFSSHQFGVLKLTCMVPPPIYSSFPTSLCPFSPLPLRVALCSPVFPCHFSDGGVAWSEDGKTGWSVQSSLGLFLGEMPVVGFMPVAGRVLDLLGQIWCYLGAILLAKLLWRSEVSAMRSSSIVNFPNKAPIHGDGLSWCGGVGMFLLPCWYGANTEEGYVNAAVHDSRLSHGISELHLGCPHMVAMAGC
jgi:hypothetical protein